VSLVKRSIGRPGASWFIQGAERGPEEISSYILKKVVSDAVDILRSENRLGKNESISDVVITCPAYFGVAEREATKRAGEIAGLNVINIINEPTAAAITYGVSNARENNVVLVYDLGGGTFDVTLIDIQPGSIKVVCTGGDHALGGKLWDDRIIEFVAGEFSSQTGNTEDILSDPETFQELALSAERAKKMLTARNKAPIAINYKGDRARVELSRDRFDKLTQDLLERTISLTREMLEEAAKKGYSVTQIDEILLVGGSTRMPQITKRIKTEFSAPVKVYDPDEAVAKGAAIFGERQEFFAQLIEQEVLDTGKSEQQVKREIAAGASDIQALAEKAGIDASSVTDAVNMNITNVTSRSFGTIAFQSIESEDDSEVLYNMILKNDELPAKEIKQFYTVAENQSSVHIRVLESLASERYAQPAEGTEIGEAILDLPEGLPPGSPLQIEFKLNEAGLLELYATELGEGRDVKARFETTDALSDAAVSEAKQRLEDSMII
jgi:molecular chaperone DnaK (HSP70)